MNYKPYKLLALTIGVHFFIMFALTYLGVYRNQFLCIHSFIDSSKRPVDLHDRNSHSTFRSSRTKVWEYRVAMRYANDCTYTSQIRLQSS